MKRLWINRSLFFGTLLVTFMGCQKDVPHFKVTEPDPVYETKMVYDTTIVYDTIVDYDTTITYDSSLISVGRKHWKVLDSSTATGTVTSSTDNAGDRTVHNLFDGQKSSYYHSGWITSPKTLFPVPHWFVVDMARPQKVDKFFYIGRTNGGPQGQTPKTIDIYASNDSTKLMSKFDDLKSSAIIIKDFDLPGFNDQQSGDTAWVDNGNTGNKIDSFRYFRFEITENYDDGKVSNFSELGVQLSSEPNQGVKNIDTSITYLPQDTIITLVDTIMTRVH